MGTSFALAHKRVTGFSIDSRNLRPGAAFIALRGPNHDGHDFVAQALDRGAAVAVVSEERRMTYPPHIFKSLIGVLDTFQALQQLARFARRTWGRAVIGVSGSTGKTTTKEMLAALLAARHRVLKSEGNLNNEYGLPLTLLRLEAVHELAVVEMAMARAGELAKLCKVAEPNIGLVTNIAPVHLEFFDSLDAIADAKRELVLGLAPPAVAVLNADDPYCSRLAEGFSGKLYRFGMEQPAEVRAENVADHGCAGSEFDLVVGEKSARVRLAMPGRAHVANALAAFAVASLFKVEPVQAVDVLAGLEPSPLRGSLVSFEPGFVLVNDAYNCNPRALAAMAEALSRTAEAGRRILVVGEMKELGPTSEQLHHQAGRAIAALGNIDLLAGVTGDARHIVAGATAAGMAADRARFFDATEAAAAWLRRTVVAGDWVLLKASRAVALETILETLRAHFAPQAPPAPPWAGPARSPAVSAKGKG
ncbi:MAG: UDP-N-acetylmuramoyl-tripeptide--D-alanyl-D-alanine ligase [Terriglobia bacterium]